MGKIELLDCTLRDGAYIVNSIFGEIPITGIIQKLGDARVDIIECGWLKNEERKVGSSFFHVRDDLRPYLPNKSKNVEYCVMIDWNRYDLKYLEQNDGTSFDAIRVVFPHGKLKEGSDVGKAIIAKGYNVYFQLSNTLAYSEKDILEVAKAMNEIMPSCVYVVDTFGAMYDDDVERYARLLHEHLDKKIKLGIHTHNNQQLGFANIIKFISIMKDTDRDIVVDSSLSGMGRGAGNAATELLANYLNNKCNAHYNMDVILDAIDIYMSYFNEKYKWGYSTPYFIAGMYCCHVNNIAYLLDNHRTKAKDMKNIIESMDPLDRRKYDYDLLETKYITNESYMIDDTKDKQKIKDSFAGREVLFIAPGKSIIERKNEIIRYIKDNKPVVIGINSIIDDYVDYYDYCLFVNPQRYEYARISKSESFNKIKKILTSNVKNESTDELIIGFNNVAKKGYKHFDNAVIMGLNILDYVGIDNVTIAGFDGFKTSYNESYADIYLPTLNPDNKWAELNTEIKELFIDFKKYKKNIKNIKFLTESIFEK